MSDVYQPPYTLSDKAIHFVADISELIGSLSVHGDMTANPRLRRDNRIKTIHASLAIENNTLSLDQVTDIVNGKRVLGAPNEIKEVRNAYEAYEHLLTYDPYSISDLLAAHKILMAELTVDVGVFRTGGVGIFNQDKLIHMAPPAGRVPTLMADLLNWTKNAPVHPLIKSSVFHYEFEFIHPFADGNGRMSRMWHTLLLYNWKPLFAWLPIETLIRERQDAYYAALAQSDASANSGPFIEYMLQVIYDTLKELSGTAQVAVQVTAQVRKLLDALGSDTLTAREIMGKLGLTHRQSFRSLYLNPAMELGLVEMTIPAKPNSSKQKYRIVRG